MKVAYIFLSAGLGIHKLINTILPELESGQHNLEVVALCFFDENASILETQNSPYAERIAKVAREKNILILIAAKEDLVPSSKAQMEGRLSLKPTECVVTVVSDSDQVGCFPSIYAALGTANCPDHFISL